MSQKTRIGAVLFTAILVLAVATPAVLAEDSVSISVNTASQTTYTVTVEANGTAVNDSMVNVTPVDPAHASYAGASGTTDANGTVTFDLPVNETDVTVTATYNGSTYSTGAVLQAANSSDDYSWAGEGEFGRWVHNLVQKFREEADHDGIGHELSSLVVSNNPGSHHRSDHAEPGDHRQDGEHAGANSHDDNGHHDNNGYSLQHDGEHQGNETVNATEIDDANETPSGNETESD